MSISFLVPRVPVPTPVNATVCTILMKFGTMTQQTHGHTQRTYGKNFEFLKSQDGGGCHLENHQKNRDISATV